MNMVYYASNDFESLKKCLKCNKSMNKDLILTKIFRIFVYHSDKSRLISNFQLAYTISKSLKSLLGLNLRHCIIDRTFNGY